MAMAYIEVCPRIERQVIVKNNRKDSRQLGRMRRELHTESVTATQARQSIDTVHTDVS
jgi:hypothetical protein